MKMLFSIVFIFLTIPTWAQVNFDYCDKDLDSIIENERKKGDFLINSRSSNLVNNYDITHQNCEWTIDPDVYYISGTITTTFTPTELGVTEIQFDLNSNMTVNEIFFEGSPLLYDQTIDHLLKVSLSTALNLGQSYQIVISYQGEPSSDGFGSFNRTTHGSGDNEASILWTLSEPYGARNWWPCKQNLDDKIDAIDIYVNVPTGNKVGSNGLLVESTVNGNGTTTYHWQHGHPIATYLVAIAVTNYVEYTDVVNIPDGNVIPVLNYVYPEDLAYAQANTPNIVPMIELFNDLFGMYPFADEKYGHAQFPWGGGMEHQTMSFMVNFNFGLMAHELAHQWFGDNITCGSWEDLWLNESFATYLTGLTYRGLGGESDFHDWKYSLINNVTASPNGSVWVSDTTDIYRLFNGRLTYRKGAIVLNMMRWKVGDEAFFEGLTNYRNNHQNGYAVTADLKAEIEGTSNIDLTEFLDDWFYGEGHPTYDVLVTTTSSSSQASVTINQTQSHMSVDFFEMPVPVHFTFIDGSDSLYIFNHISSGQVFEIEMPMPLEAVVFDPNLEILSRDNTINLNVLTGQEDLIVNKNILVYPNPASDMLSIVNLDNTNKMSQFEVFDITGVLVVSQEPYTSRNQIDLSNFVKGVYVLKVTTKDGILSKRFLVE